jgi:hypothetical protein
MINGTQLVGQRRAVARRPSPCDTRRLFGEAGDFVLADAQRALSQLELLLEKPVRC